MISVVVPVLNEVENIVGLIEEIVAASPAAGIGEIVYVDDGSSDGTLDALLAQAEVCGMLRIIHHDRPLGQSAAFLSGARAATKELLVFIDGDGQNDPGDISKLLSFYRQESLSNVRIAVLGQRAMRRDTPMRQLSSRLANRLRAAVLGDHTRDTGCSLKLIRRDDYLALPYFDHMHRFLPALLLRDGIKLHHVDVSHRPRMRGVSKYGFWNRAFIGAVDLVGVAWLLRRKLPGDYSASELVVRTPK